MTRKQLNRALLWGACVLFGTFSANATVIRVGNAWGTGKDYASFQEFLDSAKHKAASDTIYVAAGTENLRAQWNNTGHAGRFFGGFAGTEATPAQRAMVPNGNAWDFANPTVLKLADTVTVVDQSIWRNTGSAVPAEINGFTFDGSKCTGGAAIFIRTASGSALSIAQCIIRNTTVTSAPTSGNNEWGAGGISVGGCSASANISATAVTVDRCLIENNKSPRAGGYFTYSSKGPVVSSCLIRNNEGGSENFMSSPSITAGGGGVTMAGTNATAKFVNNVVVGNSSPVGGGGVATALMGCQLVNNTIVGNVAPKGAGLFCNMMLTAASYRTEAYNNIFWNNKTAEGTVANVDRNGKYLLFNNNPTDAVPDGAEGATAAGTAPTDNLLETDSAKIFGENYGTFAAAAGVDKGLTDKIPTGITTDFAGNQRSFGSAVDMGAYEYYTPYVAPSKPTDLKVQEVSDTSFVLTWTASTGAVAGYRIYFGSTLSDTVLAPLTTYKFSKPDYAIAAQTVYSVMLEAYSDKDDLAASDSLKVLTAPHGTFKKITLDGAYVTVADNSTGVASKTTSPYYFYVTPGQDFWVKIAVKAGYESLAATVDGQQATLANDTLRIAAVNDDYEVAFAAARVQYSISAACNTTWVELLTQPAATIYYDSTLTATFRLKSDKLTPYASNGTITGPNAGGAYTLTLANVKANTGLYIGAIANLQANVAVANSASVSSMGTSMLQGIYATYLKVQTGDNKDTMEMFFKFKMNVGELYSAISNGARLRLFTNNYSPTSNFPQAVWSIQEVEAAWKTAFTGVSGEGAQWADRPAVSARGEIATQGANIFVKTNTPFYIDLSSYLAQLADVTPDADGNITFALKIASKTELPSPYGSLNICNPGFANWSAANKPCLEIGKRYFALALNALGTVPDSTNANSICVGDTLYYRFALMPGYENPQCDGASIAQHEGKYILKKLLRTAEPVTLATTTNFKHVTVADNPFFAVKATSATAGAAGVYDVAPGQDFWLKFALNAGYENLQLTVDGAPATVSNDTLRIAAVNADHAIVATAERIRFAIATTCNADFIELTSVKSPDTVYYDSAFNVAFRLKSDKLTPYASAGTISGPTEGTYTLTAKNVKANTGLYIAAIATNPTSTRFANAASTSSKSTTLPGGGAFFQIALRDDGDTIATFVKYRLPWSQLLSGAANGARVKLMVGSGVAADNFPQAVWSVQEVDTAWNATFAGAGKFWDKRPAVTERGEITTLGPAIAAAANKNIYVDVTGYLNTLAQTATPDAQGNVTFALMLQGKKALPNPYGALNLYGIMAAMPDANKPALEIGKRAIALVLNTTGIAIDSTNADSICVGDTLYCRFTLLPSYLNPQCSGANITQNGDVYTLKALLKSAEAVTIAAAQALHTVSFVPYPSSYIQIEKTSAGAADSAYSVVHDSVFWVKIEPREGFENLQVLVNGAPVALLGDTLLIAAVDGDKVISFAADRKRYAIAAATCNADFIELINAPADTVYHDSAYIATFKLRTANLTPYATNGTCALDSAAGIYTLTIANVKANTDLYITAIGAAFSNVDVAQGASASSKGTDMVSRFGGPAYYHVQTGTNQDTMEAYFKFSVRINDLLSAAANGARFRMWSGLPPATNISEAVWSVQDVTTAWNEKFKGAQGETTDTLWRYRPAVTERGEVATVGRNYAVVGAKQAAQVPFYIDLSAYLKAIAEANANAEGNVEFAFKITSLTELESPYGLAYIANPLARQWQQSYDKTRLEIGRRYIALQLDTTGIAISASNADSICIGDTLRCSFTLKRGYGDPQCDGATITDNGDDSYTLALLVRSANPVVIAATPRLYNVTLNAGAGIIVTDSGTLALPLDATYTMKFKLDKDYTNPVSLVADSISKPNAQGEYTLYYSGIAADLTIAISATYSPATGIDNVNDPVVATTFYNLMGREVREPQAAEVLIVKRTHASGKITVKKELWYGSSAKR